MSLISFFCYGKKGVQREDKVSLELTEEILLGMEVGMAFRDYVCISASFFENSQFDCYFLQLVN